MFALIQGHFTATTLVPTTNQTKTWIVSLPVVFRLSCKYFVHYKLRMCEVSQNHLNECPFKTTIVASFIPQNADAEKQTILKTAL